MLATDSFQSPEEAFSFVLKGHRDAIAFCFVLCGVLHLWDDLDDRDKPIAREDINQAMYAALVVLPRNAFYQANFAELNALVDSAIMNWHAANAFEREGSDEDKRISFIIRSAYCNVILTAARIVGGYEWARSVAPALRRFWHKEGFDGYLANLSKQLSDEKELGHVLQ
ncbi:MAG: hypothetical protein KF740_12245 [Ramlibacter sp.]|nr:hypothetical protein [Ramlibacter sp.]